MAADIVSFPHLGTNDNQPDPVPPQPGLRSFIVYDELPEGCIAFEQPNRQSEPHLTAGEFAVIDTTDQEPMHGEMFLVQSLNGQRYIVVVENNSRWAGWLIGNVRIDFAYNLDGARAEPVRMMDGPYQTAHLRSKLIGKVVGIYQPDFRKQLVEAA